MRCPDVATPGFGVTEDIQMLLISLEAIDEHPAATEDSFFEVCEFQDYPRGW